MQLEGFHGCSAAQVTACGAVWDASSISRLSHHCTAPSCHRLTELRVLSIKLLTEYDQIQFTLQRFIRDGVAGFAPQSRLVIAGLDFEAINARRITPRCRVLAHHLPVIFVPNQLGRRIAAVRSADELYLLATSESLALAVALDEGLSGRF